MLHDIFYIMYIILAFLLIAGTILLITLIFILFRKTKNALDTVKAILDEVKGTTSLVSNTFIKPVVKGARMFTGAKKVFSFFSRHDEKEGEKGGKSGKRK